MFTFWSAPTSRHAFILSWISVIITLLASITGLIIWKVSGSSLVLVYSLENAVDLLSSIIVVWRFYFTGALTEDVEKHLHAREHRASMAISIILFLLGVFISSAAIDDYVKGENSGTDHGLILSISFFSIIVFGLLAMVKFNYSVLLDSSSLYKDGICSLIGTITSGALFVNTLVIDKNPELWWFDPTVALGCGIVAIILGAHAVIVAIYVEKIPLFTIHWWMVSEEEVNAAGNIKTGTNDVEITRRNEGGTMT